MKQNLDALSMQGLDFIIEVKDTAIIGRIRNVMTNNMEFPVFHLTINRIPFYLFKNIDNYFAFVLPIERFPHIVSVLFPTVQPFRICKNLFYFSCYMFRLIIFNKISYLKLVD